MSLTPETVKTLDDQVREIAGHLEMEFDQEYADRQERNWSYHAEIKSGNKRILFSTLNFNPNSALKNNGRFVIRAVFPMDKKGQIHRNYNTKHPEITVAMDRGPEKISRAIETRLLPEYEKQLTIALERIEKSNASHANRLQALQTVAKYFGQPVPENDDKAIYPEIIVGVDGNLKGLGIYKIEAASEGVKFDVSCDVQKAIKIFDVLKQTIPSPALP